MDDVFILSSKGFIGKLSQGRFISFTDHDGVKYARYDSRDNCIKEKIYLGSSGNESLVTLKELLDNQSITTEELTYETLERLPTRAME